MEALTVIICTWNRASQLRLTLESLAAQTGLEPERIEVIVVDNNSTDGTRSVVDAHAHEWRLGSLRYEFEPRQGKQFALNRGISAATHPLLAFTDDDILFAPDWLANAAAAFNEPSVQLVGGRTDVVWPPSGRPEWFADDMMAVVGAVDLGNERLDPAPPDYAPAGANLIARRTLFQQVGGFSETHYRHMDHEFGLRCQRAGVRVVYDPAPLVFAPVDPHCLSRAYFRRWAFKAGIASDGSSPALISQNAHGVPLWMYRQILEDTAALFVARAFKPAHIGFSRELRIWRRLGTVVDHWHRRLFPQKHDTWVIARSQKKNNKSF